MNFQQILRHKMVSIYTVSSPMSGWSRYFVGWSVHGLCLLVTSSSCMVTVNDRAREACCHGNNWEEGTRGQSETLCKVITY